MPSFQAAWSSQALGPSGWKGIETSLKENRRIDLLHPFTKSRGHNWFRLDICSEGIRWNVGLGSGWKVFCIKRLVTHVAHGLLSFRIVAMCCWSWLRNLPTKTGTRIKPVITLSNNRILHKSSSLVLQRPYCSSWECWLKWLEHIGTIFVEACMLLCSSQALASAFLDCRVQVNAAAWMYSDSYVLLA